MQHKKKLTSRQEAFAFNVASGLSQYESYINAGYSNNPNRVIVDTNAYKLSNNNQIITRITELKATTESKKVLNLTQRKEKLSQIVTDGNFSPENITHRDRLSAIDLLNKMDKVYSDAPIIQLNTQVIFQIGKGYQEQLPEGSKPLLMEEGKNEC